MASEQNLISVNGSGSLDFGDYSLTAKAKEPGFEFKGDLYKVKTFRDITKLEKNEMFVYESVPGTNVKNFIMEADGVRFCVEGPEDAQITLEMEPETEYEAKIGDEDAGTMKTNLGGKLVLSVELGDGPRDIEVKRMDG